MLLANAARETNNPLTCIIHNLESALHAHDVTVADSATEAQRFIGSGSPFDPILCDVLMLAESGIDLYGWLAERAPPLAARMILVSGGAFTRRSREFLARIARSILTKAVSDSELSELVSRHPASASPLAVDPAEAAQQPGGAEP